MEKLLTYYIKKNIHSLDNAQWSTESVTQSGEELFADLRYQQLYENIMLDTLLYYPDNMNTEICPFEVRHNGTIIALGYLDEINQNIIYLKANDEVIINLIH